MASRETSTFAMDTTNPQPTVIAVCLPYMIPGREIKKQTS